MALIQLFQSPRFSGGYQVGETIDIVETGIGVALTTGSVQRAFENMAATMTEQIRSNSNETVRGFVVAPVVFVRVRWVWLALPAILSIATVVLLLGSILNSWCHQRQLWKSSQVALLLHNVVVFREDSSVVLRADTYNLNQLEAFGERTRAKLE